MCIRDRWEIHEDSQLSMTYKMSDPGWFQIMMGVRSNDLDPSYVGNYELQSNYWPKAATNEWRTVRVPLSAFRKNRRATEYSALPAESPRSGDLVTLLWFSTGDHDRGLVLGDVTWGKGLVQTVFTVRDTGLALTTAYYYTPSGRSIQRDYDSFIDYITHRNGNNGGNGDDIHETAAGRTVLGGGGITPDVTLESRTLSENLARLYGNSAFFRFGVKILQDVPEDEQESFGRAFAVDDELLERFFEWVGDEEILPAENLEELKSTSQDISDVSLGIKVEVLNATLGLDEGYQAALESDNQFEATLEHLEEAQDFWIAWQESNLD